MMPQADQPIYRLSGRRGYRHTATLFFLDEDDEDCVEGSSVLLSYGFECGVNLVGQARVELLHGPSVVLE